MGKLRPSADLCNRANLRAPRPARLPKPKTTTINPKDSRYERGTTGGQVTSSEISRGLSNWEVQHDVSASRASFSVSALLSVSFNTTNQRDASRYLAQLPFERLEDFPRRPDERSWPPFIARRSCSIHSPIIGSHIVPERLNLC